MNKALLFLIACGFGWGQLTAQEASLIRSIDGYGNNPENPDWGAAHTTLRNQAGIAFADSIGAPTGTDRPNPRYLSNLIFSQPDLLPDPMTLSDFCWVFGQFMDHDLGLTVDGNEFHPIPVPRGDPNFDPLGFGTVMIPMMRNAFVGGTSTSDPRRYVNEITAFIDGSAVYGSDQERADWLRSFEGGRLKVSTGDLLPYNTTDGEFGSPVDPGAPHMDDAVGFATRLFVAGDVRANENPLLAALHTIFVREHNRQCELLAAEYPDWNDEQLYQRARKIVGGLIQSITYNQWLPTMGVVLEPYAGFKPDVNPQLDNVFTAAAFRLGHTLLNGNIRRVDENGQEHPEGHLSLKDAFFNPSALAEVDGLDPFLAGMAQQTQQSMDSRIVDDVRNFLFGPPGAGGLDLAAININRGRERGLPSFNQIRRAYGLQPYTFVGQINSDITTYTQLFEAYFGDVRRIDPWVGMLAEKRMPGALFGPTIMAIMKAQFGALRDGDRFFYLNDPVLSEAEKAWIDRTTFRDVIMYNTGISLMQDNVFQSISYEEICDNMTANAAGRVNVHTTGVVLPDVQVNLVKNGESVDNLITNAAGTYRFSDLAACDPVTLSPLPREDEWINGVSVQDIVILARHILGLEDITDPYALLAADANLDGRIRVTDIIAVRRLILGLDAQLPGDGPQWNYVPASYVFTDPANPWAEDVPSTIELATPTLMMEDHRFVAYKRGDVNATANVSADNYREAVGRSTTEGLIVTAADRALPAGVPTEVILTVSAATEVTAYQFSLVGRGADVEAVSSVDLPDDYFHLNDRGSLRFCGEHATVDGQRIVLRITAATDTRLSEVLELAEYDLPALALSADRESVAVEFVLQSTQADSVDRRSVHLTAYPNPFTDRLSLRVPITVVGPARLELFDGNGRLVLAEERELSPASAYDWTVATGELPAGRYAYRVVTARGAYAGKVVRVGR